MTSHDVCHKLRKILNTKKIGHTGTLDPMATGVMGVLVGRATKLSEYITASNKEYIAGIKFGVKSASYDTDEELIQVQNPDFSKEELLQVLDKFIGKIKQKPPIYSAVKVDGRPLYKYAREGKKVEIPGREVEIYSIDLIDDDNFPKTAKIKVSCGSGTYIRSLINDIGEKLGSGAVMSSLERTRNGKLEIKDSYTLKEIEDNIGRIDKIILPEYDYLEGFTRVDVKPESSKIVLNGNILLQKNMITNIKELDDNMDVKIYLNDKFIGLGIKVTEDDDSIIKPKKILYGE